MAEFTRARLTAMGAPALPEDYRYHVVIGGQRNPNGNDGWVRVYLEHLEPRVEWSWRYFRKVTEFYWIRTYGYDVQTQIASFADPIYVQGKIVQTCKDVYQKHSEAITYRRGLKDAQRRWSGAYS